MFQPRTLLVGFLSVLIGANSARAENYKEERKEAVLIPGHVTGAIISVTWKHYADIALEWYGGNVSCYRHFRGRCTLNKTTGEMTIRNLMKEDSGSYQAEINNRLLQTTEILVISPVPPPTLNTRCNTEKTHCVLTCEGNTTGAEPVSYVWMSGDTILPSSSPEHNITKEETKDSISCMMTNPVSNSSSEVQNPFRETNSRNRFGILFVIVPVLILVLVISGIIFKRKHKSRKVKTASQSNSAETERLNPPKESSPGAQSFSRDVEEGAVDGNEERGGQDAPPEIAASEPSENDTHTNRDEAGVETAPAAEEEEEEEEGRDSETEDLAASDLQVTSPSPDGGEDSTQPEDKPLCPYDPKCFRKNPEHRRDFRHTTEPGIGIKVELGDKERSVSITEPTLKEFLDEVSAKFKVPAAGVKVFDSAGTELDDDDSFKRAVEINPPAVLTVKYNQESTKSS